MLSSSRVASFTNERTIIEPATLRLLSLSHSYPSSSQPWITPFVKDFMLALIRFAPHGEYHLSIPEIDELGDERGALYHEFNPGSCSLIPHKKLSGANNQPKLQDSFRYVIAATRNAIHIIKDNNIDLVHAHWALPSGLVAFLCKKITGVPYVVTTHGKDVLQCPEYGYNIPNRPFLRILLKTVLKSADRVITTSPVTDAQAEVIAPSCSRTLIPVGVSELFLAKKIPPQKPERLIYCGDLIPRKGVDLFLRAVASSESLRRMPVEIIGQGPERTSLQEISQELSLNVTFLGALGHTELVEHLSPDHILVAPSYIEAFGIITLEALSLGLRVVSADTGVASQLKESPIFSNSVFVFQPGSSDKLKEVLLKSLQHSYSPENYQQVRTEIERRYSWPRIAAYHLDLYSKILNNETKK